MQKDYFIISIKNFFFRYKEELLRAIEIAPDLWDIIQAFLIPMF